MLKLVFDPAFLPSHFHAIDFFLHHKSLSTVPPASSTSGASCGQEDLHDQIVTEINARADYLEEMEALGELSKAEKKRLQGEIRSRTLELERLKI